MDYSSMTNEELKSLYSQRQRPDYSKMSDEELKSLYSQRQSLQPNTQTAPKPNVNVWDAPMAFAGGVSQIPAAAINTLTFGKSRKLLSPLVDYQPDSMVGKVAKFGGEIAPYFLMGEASIPAQAIAGGVQGYTSAVNKGEAPLDVIKETATGAGVGAVGGGLIKASGKIFENIAPKVAEQMAGIPQSAYKEALNNPRFFEGNYNKNDIKSGLQYVQEQAGQDVNKAVRGLTDSDAYNYDKVTNTLQGVIKDSYNGADTSARYNAAKSVIDNATKSHLDAPIYDNISKQTGIPTEVLKSSGMNIDKMNSNIASYLKTQKLAEIEQKYGITPEQFMENIDSGISPEQLGINPEDLRIKRITVTPEDLQIKPANLHQYKEQIQGAINFDAPETKLGSKLLKPLQEKAASIIEADNPEYARANELYSNIDKSLGNKAMEDGDGTAFNFKNIKEAVSKANPDMPIDPTNTLMDRLKSADNAKQFLKEMDVLNKRGYFERTKPNQGTTDFKLLRNSEAAGGFVSALSLLHGNFVPLALQALATLGVSPATQKGVLQAYKAGAPLSGHFTKIIQQAINDSKGQNQ